MALLTMARVCSGIMLLLICMAIPFGANASVPWVYGDHGQMDYDRHVDWFVEGKSPQSPEDILRGTWPDGRALQFTNYSEAMSLRDAEHPVWMRWTVRNNSKGPLDGVMFSSRAQIFRAALYWYDRDGELQRRQVDVVAGLRDTVWPEMVMNFPLQLARGEERVYALYVPTLAMPGVFEMRQTPDFLTEMGALKTLYAIIVGVLAGMALYQMALAFFVYPGRSAAGSIFIGVVIWFILAKSGLLYPLHNGLALLVARYVVFSEAIMLVAGMYFARDVLSLKQQLPQIDKAAAVLQYLPLLACVFFFIDWSLAATWLRLVAPLTGIVIIGSALYLVFRFRDVMARLTLAGWVPIVFSGLIYVLFAMGWIRSSFTVQAIIDLGFLGGVLVFSHGVSLRIAVDRRDRLDRLATSEERYALAMEGSREGLFDWDFLADSILVNKRAEAILETGDNKTHYTSYEFRHMLETGARELFNRDLATAVKNGDMVLAGEYGLAGSQDRHRHVTLSASLRYDEEGAVIRMVGSLSDVTDRHKMEEQLRHSALHDQLTNLPNRSLLMDRIEVSLLRHKRDGKYHFGILFIDLDRFKVINDSLGHVIGDAYLVGVARRLEYTVRAVDTLARWGGDEFVILMEALDQPEDAAILARRIEEVLMPTLRIQGHELSISASIGVVTSAVEFDTAEELIHDADVAMYAAKENGRGRVVTFDDSMREGATRRHDMESRLREALDNNEFELHYQPIFALEDDPVVLGFEALLRWRRQDTKELLPPHEFLSIAEENGLIRDIGAWTIEAAVKQIAHWRIALDRPDLFVNVNISASQLDDPQLQHLISHALEAERMPAEILHIEVLESAIMANPDVANEVLNHLADMGVHITVDNFGTGYSSFSYLHTLPFSSLKVDRSLAADIHLNSDERRKMAAIIAMCQQLGVEAIAEGIETMDQYKTLGEIGCRMGQGYLVSRPVDAETAAKQIADSRPLDYQDTGLAI